RHTISKRDWSSDVCSSDLEIADCIGVTQTPNPPKIFRYPWSSRPKAEDYAEWKPEDHPRERPIRIAEESSSGIAEKAFFYRILCGSVKRNLSTASWNQRGFFKGYQRTAFPSDPGPQQCSRQCPSRDFDADDRPPWA